METIKTFVKKYDWVIVIIVFAALVLTIFSIQSGCETKQFNKTIDNRSMQSNKAVQEAANAENQAVNASIERARTDAVREQVITPKINSARAQSTHSAQSVKNAKQKFNEIQKTLHNVNADRAANCAELQSLFPNEQFEYCLDR